MPTTFYLFFISDFYMTCLFKKWRIMTLHNFLSFIALSNLYPLITPSSPSPATYLRKLPAVSCYLSYLLSIMGVFNSPSLLSLLLVSKISTLTNFSFLPFFLKPFFFFCTHVHFLISSSSFCRSTSLLPQVSSSTVSIHSSRTFTYWTFATRAIGVTDNCVPGNLYPLIIAYL